MSINSRAVTSAAKRSRSSANPHVTNEPPKLKAVLDGRHLPIELFGCGRASHIRKLVYNYIATWADPDGTDAYPSLETVARDCGLTVRGLRNVISWLEEYGLIRVEYKASPVGTNRYTVLFSEEDQVACRAALKRDEDQQLLGIKAEQTSRARSLAAKARWAKHKTKGKGDREQYLLAEQPEVENTVFLEHQERIASDGGRFACEQGTGCIEPGTHGSHDRPSDRQEVNRQIVPSTTPSVRASEKTRDPNPPSRPAARDERLGDPEPQVEATVSEASVAPGSGIAEVPKLCADLYEVGRQPFTGKLRQEISNLLKIATAKEILAAWKEFIRDMDNYDLNFAPRKFCEGGGEDIIAVCRREAQRAAATKRMMEISLKQEQERAEAELQRMREEEEREIEEPLS